MKTKLLISLVSCFFLFSLFFFCSKNHKKEEDLGNNYFYLPFQEHIFDATSFGGNGIYKYKNYSRVPVVYSNIIDYKKDSSYIIAKQEFDFNETKKLLQNMLFLPNVYFTNDSNYTKLHEIDLANISPSMSTIESDKYVVNLMNSNTAIKKMKLNSENYYIINKIENKIYGPLQKKEFEMMISKLQVRLTF